MSRAIAGIVLAIWLCPVAHAQSAPDAKPAEAKLAFEVASMKPSALPGRGAIRLGPQGGPCSGDPGRVAYTFNTIRDLVVEAYSIKRNQISGGPGWLDSERFDIVAKVPAAATKEQVKVMLQNLLTERFKLALHRETKVLPIYALVAGAKGPKLKDSTVTDAPPAADGWKLCGTTIFACPDGPTILDYIVACDAAWQTQSARIIGAIGDRRIDLTVSVDAERRWRLNGAECASVEGSIDIDLGFSPSTNLLPVRRLKLAVGEEAQVSAAWLPFPSLSFELLPQRYRRESEGTYRYESAVLCGPSK